MSLNGGQGKSNEHVSLFCKDLILSHTIACTIWAKKGAIYSVTMYPYKIYVDLAWKNMNKTICLG